MNAWLKKKSLPSHNFLFLLSVTFFFICVQMFVFFEFQTQKIVLLVEIFHMKKVVFWSCIENNFNSGNQINSMFSSHVSPSQRDLGLKYFSSLRKLIHSDYCFPILLSVKDIKSFLFLLCSDFEMVKSVRIFMLRCVLKMDMIIFFVYANCLQKGSILNNSFSLPFEKQIDIRRWIIRL